MRKILLVVVPFVVIVIVASMIFLYLKQRGVVNPASTRIGQVIPLPFIKSPITELAITIDSQKVQLFLASSRTDTGTVSLGDRIAWEHLFRTIELKQGSEIALEVSSGPTIYRLQKIPKKITISFIDNLPTVRGKEIKSASDSSKIAVTRNFNFSNDLSELTVELFIDTSIIPNSSKEKQAFLNNLIASSLIEPSIRMEKKDQNWNTIYIQKMQNMETAFGQGNFLVTLL